MAGCGGFAGWIHEHLGAASWREQRRRRQAAAAFACAGSDSPSSSRTAAPAGTPQPGGTLETAIFFDPDNLDPAQGGFAFIVFQRLYSYLHHIDGRTLEYIPDVATSYEQPDDLTYVFNLRPGVKFHNTPPANGRELTARDVAYSFNRLTEVLNPIDPGFMSRVVDSAEATDDYTFRVTTKKPYSSAMQVMGGLLVRHRERGSDRGVG